ncbi:MAG: PBSX family phage terminase large subunit [Anaerolineae bacterium]|nr:PBSX family phage terminase large subunit [Anaerolineae bacterium]MBT6322548.1 PBSX family phage terminase large subunit [Anaerolineae bacterium]
MQAKAVKERRKRDRSGVKRTSVYIKERDAYFTKDIINEIYFPHLENMTRTQIFYGGSSSGKSVFLAQRAVYDLLTGGRNYLACRHIGGSLADSVFKEIKKVIIDGNLTHLFQKLPKTLGTITCTNGYQAVFKGLDDAEKVKSITPMVGVFTDIWIEEATETSRNTIKALYKRQRGGDPETKKRLTLSFNPILQDHWIYSEHFQPNAWIDKQTIFDGENVFIIKSTYKDNLFLTPEDIEDLENEEDKYFYEVYTLGNWGVLGNVIFKNYELRDLSGMRDQFTELRFGLDFGFADDEAALWASHIDTKKKEIYIFAEVYELGLTNPELADKIRAIVGHHRVVCDSAEPKSIKELRDNRINAVGAKKGQGSVNFGIQWMQQHKLIFDLSCINGHNEVRQYKWKEGRDGKPVTPPTPVGKNDHLIAAGRYAHEEDSYLVKSGFARVRN